MMMPMPMPMPGGGAGAGAGADGAGAAAGAAAGEFDDGLGHVEGEDAAADAGFVNSNNTDSTDEWGNSSGGFDETPTDDFSAPDEGNEWGTFAEADHGFTEEPSNDDWSDPSDGAGDDEGASSIFDIISDIFKDS